MVTINQNTVTISFAGVRFTYYRCAGCCGWFSPAAPWDEYCDTCWERQQATTVNALAAREQA